MAAKRKKKGYNAGTTSIIFIVLVFVVVMSFQIYKLKEKDKLLAEREAMLEQQLTEEMERADRKALQQLAGEAVKTKQPLS